MAFNAPLVEVPDQQLPFRAPVAVGDATVLRSPGTLGVGLGDFPSVNRFETGDTSAWSGTVP
jgi:hypothetical protein